MQDYVYKALFVSVCGVPVSEQRGQKELLTNYHSLNEIKIVENYYVSKILIGM